MKIQLKTREGKVLYKLEKSELFPSYRAVLVEAISLGTDLTGLYVVNEEINNVDWKGACSSSFSFKKCSMRRNKFIDGTYDFLGIGSSDLTGATFKTCKIKSLHCDGSNLRHTFIRNSSWHSSFLIRCELTNASFYNCDLTNIGFHTANLSETIFNKCRLDNSSFIHPQPNSGWMNNTTFLSCSFKECSMEYVKDISQLFFWDSNLRDIYFDFGNEERFTEIENENSKVVYAIDSDVVWWKPPSWEDKEKGIFRGTLKEFTEEVRNEFSLTDLDPSGMDYEIEEELLHVCKYLASWKNNEAFSK
jgi:uncharacterized protein YjbI with pentapeptide repeats